MIGSESAARPVWAEVDLGAITHNITRIRQQAGRPVQFILPIKANAYGHGAIAISQHLERLGVDAIATANIDEAIAVRKAGVRMPIVMYASHLPTATATLLEYGLTPTIADHGGLAAAAGAGTAQRPVAVHVEIDAGLGRLGVRHDDADEFIAAVVAEPRVQLEGLYTHAPFSDASGAIWAQRRVNAFSEFVRNVEEAHGLSIKFAQACASSAIMTSMPDRLNTVAPGHLAYGISPLNDVGIEELGFRAALQALRAQVIHIGRREPGDDLASGTATRAARTAVLLIGIDNGFEFAAGSDVLLRERRCPVLSVTAEYTVIDTSALAQVSVGDVATIIGHDGTDSITLHDVASTHGRSPGYWMMGLRRIPYTYT